MFCRYCGAHIAEDSVFCAKCGKRLGSRENPRIANIVRKFRLKTPYPYFALLLVLFITWAIGPRGTRADYSHAKFSFELDKKMENRDENLYQQALSLVVENTGTVPLQEIPVDLTARIEPQKQADVTAAVLGRRLLIMQQGHPLPLTILLTGPIAPGTKKRFFIEGGIQAQVPFKVTYEVRAEGERPMLANYVVEQ